MLGCLFATFYFCDAKNRTEQNGRSKVHRYRAYSAKEIW